MIKFNKKHLLAFMPLLFKFSFSDFSDLFILFNQKFLNFFDSDQLNYKISDFLNLFKSRDTTNVVDDMLEPPTEDQFDINKENENENKENKNKENENSNFWYYLKIFGYVAIVVAAIGVTGYYSYNWYNFYFNPDIDKVKEIISDVIENKGDITALYEENLTKFNDDLQVREAELQARLRFERKMVERNPSFKYLFRRTKSPGKDSQDDFDD